MIAGLVDHLPKLLLVVALTAVARGIASKVKQIREKRRAKANAEECRRRGFSVLIVGCGVSGISAAIRLRSMGIPFIVVEKREHLGGTWWDNIYPGCQCDIPSILYSFSFKPSPRKGWPRHFPYQPDILAYLEETVDEYLSGCDIRYNAEVETAEWDDASHKWVVTMRDGTVLRPSVIINGTGALHKPQYPNIPGREAFKGPSLHTARWDPLCDVEGKTIAMIGSAASAIQTLPELAPKAASVHVFQRTPNWVSWKPDGNYPWLVRVLLRYLPGLERGVRGCLYWRMETVFQVIFRHREWGVARYQEGMIRNSIYKTLPAEKAERSIPSYPLGCKRILLSNDWYPALARPNVSLVTDPIKSINETGVTTASGHYKVDIIVYATGFDLVSSMSPYHCKGRDGREIAEGGKVPDCYLGCFFPGYPNFMMMMGPNTGLGHNSVYQMVEAQTDCIAITLQMMIDRKATSLEVKSEVADKYTKAIQGRLQDSVWKASNCRSWYQSEDGRIVALYPGSTMAYRRECHAVSEADFSMATAT